MQNAVQIDQNFVARPLEDFSLRQERYQSMKLAERARVILTDAEPALLLAEHILSALASHVKTRQIFADIRNNPAITGKMRPSETKNMLMDGGNDFVDVTRRKLAAWRKTMKRLAGGEGIISDGTREYIPAHAPLALAIAGVSTVSNYLSVVQVALSEMAKVDVKHATKHTANLAKIRRCATVLSDCELASAIDALVH